MVKDVLIKKLKDNDLSNSRIKLKIVSIVKESKVREKRKNSKRKGEKDENEVRSS